MASFTKKAPLIEIGSPPPIFDPASVHATKTGVDFCLEFQGVIRQISVTSKAFEVMEASTTGEADFAASFSRNQPRILGVASRSLKAGTQSNPLILGASHFAAAPVVMS